MKTPTQKILAAVTLLAAVMLVPSASADVIVNVDFNGHTGTQIAPTTYVGIGPVGSGTFFNGIAVESAVAPLTASSLLDMNGANTGIGFSFAAVNGSNYNDPNQGGAHVLADDAWYNTDPINFSISGLTGSTADLYFYGRMDGAAFPDITITGASPVAFTPTGVYNSNVPPDPSWVLYFQNVTATAGTISGTVNSPSIIGGMTIVDAVPEPSILSMLGLVGIGFLMRRNSRRARI